MKTRSFLIGKVPVGAVTRKDVTDLIEDTVRKKESGYICVSNMRTVTIANKDSAYRGVMENSLVNTPDGRPLLWCARAWGLKDVEPVVGPELMMATLKDGSASLKHFFLGDTDQTLEIVCQKCREEYGVDPAGVYSPPFAPLESYDMKGIAERINKSGANVVWTSLRAPKQDFLAVALLPFLKEGTVVIGVGAAFRFLTGEFKMENGLLRKMGLGGLQMVRNSNPWNEFTWHVKHGFWLIRYLVGIYWKRLILRKKPDEA